MPIGKGEKEENFTHFQFNARKGDIIYLYTDGFADQFGGPKGKKLKYKQLEEFILANQKKDLNEQKQILETNFVNWKMHYEQVDDVTVLGIRI